MKPSRLINLFIVIALLACLVVLRLPYEELIGRIHVQELFGHTLYRFLMAFFVVEALKGVIFLFYRPTDPSRNKDNFTIGVNHISKVLYGLFFITLVLSIFNISIKEAFTTLSLIAAAVVLMTKDYISNLINGMYLTFARVITIGDQVMIDKHKGKIVDITLTNVQLLNEDDDMIFIPNNLVFTKEIINYTRRDLKKTTIEFEAAAGVIRDVAALEQEIIEALADYQHEIQPGSYSLKTSSIRADVIQFKFQYILKEPLNKETDKKIRRFLVRWIVRRTAPDQPVIIPRR
jgi:small-conductance mechanosensitive channel